MSAHYLLNGHPSLIGHLFITDDPAGGFAIGFIRRVNRALMEGVLHSGQEKSFLASSLLWICGGPFPDAAYGSAKRKLRWFYDNHRRLKTKILPPAQLVALKQSGDPVHPLTILAEHEDLPGELYGTAWIKHDRDIFLGMSVVLSLLEHGAVPMGSGLGWPDGVRMEPIPLQAARDLVFAHVDPDSLRKLSVYQDDCRLDLKPHFPHKFMEENEGIAAFLEALTGWEVTVNDTPNGDQIRQVVQAILQEAGIAYTEGPNLPMETSGDIEDRRVIIHLPNAVDDAAVTEVAHTIYQQTHYQLEVLIDE